MTGSLQIKNNKYYAVLNLKNPSGGRKAKWIGTGLEVRGNKRKATQVLQKLIEQYEAQESVPEGGDILFADFLQSWLDNKKDKIELSTWEGYKMYTANHIIPYFRNLGLTLNQLAPRHFVDYYECKFRSGRLDGKEGGLSIRSIKSHSLIIKEALNVAVILEYLPRNPALNVPLPKQEVRQNIGKFLDVQQANTILQAFCGHNLQPVVYITLYYGLRRSEVLGLRWRAIDFANNTVSINHTVVKNITTVAKDKTKTASSNRTYQLLPEIKEMLLTLKSQAEENQRLFGKEYVKSDYIFVWPNGIRFSPDYLTKGFQRVLRNNNISHMRFHDLRHSTASILYDKGWSLKDIQEWLGHGGHENTQLTKLLDLRRLNKFSRGAICKEFWNSYLTERFVQMNGHEFRLVNMKR